MERDDCSHIVHTQDRQILGLKLSECERFPPREAVGVGYSEKKLQVDKHLKVIYHPLYSMINFVTNKSKLPQDGAQVGGSHDSQSPPYMG